jgi:hypothetical protein
MPVRPLALLAFLILGACAARGARDLDEPEVRLHLGDQVVATLDRQRHYFPSVRDRRAFASRLHGIARSTGDATTFYREMSSALASLREGHTGLVGSAQVPFANTIPPVALLEVDGQPVVAGVTPGVENGGLRPGDVVLSVDGVPASASLDHQLAVTSGSTDHARRARALSNLLAGPTKTPAEVIVRGIDGRERRCFPLRFLLDDGGVYRSRFGFQPETIEAVRIAPSAGYISLPDFHPDRRSDFEDALKTLRPLPDLVLDLRGNPGGRIRSLQRIAGAFLNEQVDLLLMEEGGHTRPLPVVMGPVHYRGRLSILVDERTGSAAELLAAALQDLGRARIFGRTTAGSTRSRQTALLPGGVVFHYAGPTEFLRRDGSPIEGLGVEPDFRYLPSRQDLALGLYGDPFRDPLVRLALATN